jgi:RsiW-degrading membrane proteinase PrsW (M82 family)
LPEPTALLSAVVLAGVPSLIYLAVLNAIDRYEKEPWTILIACVAGGAIIAPIASVALVGLTGRPTELTPSLAPGAGGADPVVAVIQEVVKGIVLIVLTRGIRSDFDDVLDGVVYGAALGAGFAATETLVYAAGGTAGLDAATIGALLVSGLNHAFYGAVLGAILGAARRLNDPRLEWIVALYGLLTAALLHALHDALPQILARLLDRPDAAVGLGTRVLADGVNALGLITLAVAIAFAWRRESRIVRDELRDEVDSGVVPIADYEALPSARRRLSRQVATLRQGGVGQVRDLRRLFATEGELAFHKWRLATRRRHRPDPARTDLLRDEIARLRSRLVEDAP